MTGKSPPRATDTSFGLALACLAVALVLLPLAFAKPGIPAALAPKEIATYLAARSLARDHDFVCADRDLARLFHDYPFGARAIFLTSPDDWKSARFAIPPVYPLLLAPLVAAFAGNGPIALNGALLAAMIAVAAYRLRRDNSPGVALLFATGFFAMTPLFVYGMMVRNEVFAAALGFFALALATNQEERRETDIVRASAAVVASAILLAVAVSEQPVLVVLLLPVLGPRLARPRFRAIKTWLAVFATTLMAVVGLSVALSGSVAPWLARASAAPLIDGPRLTLPPVASPAAAAASPARPRLELAPGRIGRDIVYFFVGRHAGILFYTPFAIFAWLLSARTHRFGHGALTVAIAVAMGICLALLPGAWQGGGEAIGNRYFLALYPCLILMVGRVAPVAPMVAAWALGGLSLGPLLFTTLGPAVPSPDRQTHARHRLLRQLPLERTLLDGLDGYAVVFAGTRVRWLARADTIERDGRILWVHGALPVELWLVSQGPVDPIDVELTSLAVNNVVTIDDGGGKRKFTFPATDGDKGLPAAVTTTLRPRDCARLSAASGNHYSCRLTVYAKTGDWPRWHDISRSDFLAGVGVTVLNDPESAPDGFSGAP